MSCEFIKELSEAKLFVNPTRMDNVSVGKLADSFFNAVLGLHILKNTDPKAASKYAAQTLKYGGIDGWRSSATDLHNMAWVLSNPRAYNDRLQFDRNISMPGLQFKTYLKNVINGKDDPNFDRQFLLRLQSNLGVGSDGLRSARRLIGDWPRALPDERELAATRVYLGMQHDLSRTDMWSTFSRIATKKKLIAKDVQLPQKEGMPLWAKLAIAGVAGYALGKKLSTM